MILKPKPNKATAGFHFCFALGSAVEVFDLPARAWESVEDRLDG